jgi:hypothetical protein
MKYSGGVVAIGKLSYEQYSGGVVAIGKLSYEQYCGVVVAIGKLSYKQYFGGVIAIDSPQVTYPYRFLAPINCSKIPAGNKHTHTHGFEPENIN